MVCTNQLFTLLTVPSIASAEWLAQPMNGIETCIGIVFAIEFMSRWISTDAHQGTYWTRPLVWVDVIAVVLPLIIATHPTTCWHTIPFVPDCVTSSSTLVNLRLLRILCLQRVLSDINTFNYYAQALGIAAYTKVQSWQLPLACVVLSIFTLLSVSSGLIYTTEHGTNPNIPGYFAALQDTDKVF